MDIEVEGSKGTIKSLSIKVNGLFTDKGIYGQFFKGGWIINWFILAKIVKYFR
jgi:hypothetical protein